jgi:Protein of unknown function (DUF3300)
MIRMATTAIAAALLFATSHLAAAQTQTAAVQSDELLKPEQLDALVAPIALYPDTLLAEVLMASTYPLEVVEAERWVQANNNLSGADLKAAVDKQSWDDSVKSLAATPSVLEMMSSKLDWTQNLGNAVLAQQADVMDAIQRLRSKAQANNKLGSNQQQTVSTQQQAGRDVIVIQPTQPDTVYVPYYDPSVVYGSWPYPAYPPYYFGAPGYIAAGVIATGIAFGTGYALGRWASGGYRWGGGVNWGGNNIAVNRPVNINNIGNNWTHNPAHRQGVRYANANVAQKFGGGRNGVGGGAKGRLDFRGRGGNQVLPPSGGNLGGNRGNLGGGAGGNRPSAGNRTNLGGGGGGGRPGGGNALGNISSGRVASLEGARGRASLGGGGGGGARMGGGGGARMGGGGGFRGGGGGRRSDIRLKHDVVLLCRLDNGIGFYRFAYSGSEKLYVGVMAQEVQAVRPDAVTRGRDGYLRVFYDRLGLKFETYQEWLASGARVPVVLAH